MVLASSRGLSSRLLCTCDMYAGCSRCTGGWDRCWLQQMLCAGCSECYTLVAADVLRMGKGLAGYDICHCLGAITALQHSCILYTVVC